MNGDQGTVRPLDANEIQHGRTLLGANLKHQQIADFLRIPLVDFEAAFAAEIEERDWLNDQMRDWKPQPYREEDADSDQAGSSAGGPACDPPTPTAPPSPGARDMSTATPPGVSLPPLSPNDRAVATALIVGGFSIDDLAAHFQMTADQCREAFAEEIRVGDRKVRATLTTKLVADGLSAPGPARNRMLDFLNVMNSRQAKSAPAPLAPHRGRIGMSTGRRGERFGGPMPPPGPDGVIRTTMKIGDFAMRERMNLAQQREEREAELLAFRQREKSARRP